MVIRKILLDAFGTIFSPHTPVHVQYAEVALRHGLKVDAEHIKSGFKTAYRHWAATHPMYGKLSTPPLTPESWWRGLIHDAFLHAGVSVSDLEPVEKPLTTTLIQRFWSTEGYSLHEDVRPFLSSLASHSSSLSPHPAVVSGSDNGIKKVLRSLEVIAGSNTPGGIKEEEIWTSWDLEAEKKDEAFWVRVLERINSTSSLAPLKPSEVLVIGDELIPDYLTPRKVGMRSLLLRRFSETGEHARSSYEHAAGEEKDVDVVESLKDVMSWIEKQ
ncbi:hypothetical protein BCR35DRAFT_350018 [Leucosporidium creatinivorum]|uniref:HAD-like domain-containing protein n=1 Tax=Leucosporidium creatinivorum TaxID=106004 RepID=A0A1Y2G0X4_9BASI|nr:hypothetical protein BCR35DRAFT_350018 [Leucosporidium creatinivorum]